MLEEYRQFRRDQIATKERTLGSAGHSRQGQGAGLAGKLLTLMRIRAMQMELEEQRVLAAVERRTVRSRALSIAEPKAGRHQSILPIESSGEDLRSTTAAEAAWMQWAKEKKVRANPPLKRKRLRKFLDEPDPYPQVPKSIFDQSRAAPARSFQLQRGEFGRSMTKLPRRRSARGRNPHVSPQRLFLQMLEEEDWTLEKHMEKKLQLKQYYYGKLMARFR